MVLEIARLDLLSRVPSLSGQLVSNPKRRRVYAKPTNLGAGRFMTFLADSDQLLQEMS